MSKITPEHETRWLDSALTLDQSKDPEVRSKARFIRAMAAPLSRYIEEEIRRADGDPTVLIPRVGLNLGGFLSAAIGSDNKRADVEVKATLIISIVLGMSSSNPGGVSRPDLIAATNRLLGAVAERGV